MFDFATLSRKPAAFRSLTGMDPAEFTALAGRFAEADRVARAASATTVRDAAPRRRVAGGGHPFRNGVAGRLLMALVWLRTYPTYEVLGYFFGLHKRNAQLNVRRTLEVLRTTHGFEFDDGDGQDDDGGGGGGGPKNRRRLSTPAQVMTAFPAVRLVVDTKEQRVCRPAGAYEVQKPYYSGKKKCHTLKTQLAVGPDGLIESVSDSYPGGATHDVTLLRATGLLDRLDRAAGEAAMADKGYDALRVHYPGRPLVLPVKARRNHPLDPIQKAANRVIAGYRIVVEHAIAQVNRFTVLRQVFRGRTKRHDPDHGRVVRVVAGLVNLRTQVCPLKTYAAAA